LGAGIVLKYASDYADDDNCIDGCIAISPYWNWNVRGPSFAFWNWGVLNIALKQYYINNIRSFLKYHDTKKVKDVLLSSHCDDFNAHAIVHYKDIYGFETLQDYYNSASPLFYSHKIRYNNIIIIIIIIIVNYYCYYYCYYHTSSSLEYLH